ncbi:Choline dehydrogenase [Rhodococcus pyridinivorans]|uniref:GMC family oxidoreductase n=1 Tax=Rhodococcus pyridinivorans TaxID=103816 RepID=UPI0007CD6B39|nr:GMC family oxidoreductase [Rhodococcus pyridinivorans]SEE11226.1 Choline dehydrogenase [Rhodococcus pyridinivorans]
MDLLDSSAEVYDVIVVGSGPSGAVAAKRFAESGFSVLCLEQGEYPDYTSIRSADPEFELTKDKHFSWNPNTRQADSDYPINDADSEVAPLMWNGVGGSSILYAAAWHRLKPSDFRVKTLDGVAADWPLSYEDLAPFYARVETDFSVSGVPGDPAYPEGFDIPLPPFPLGDLERRFAAAHDRLGWHWWPGSNAIATVRHGALEPCVRRASCMWGCFDGAKASVDRTHWPKAVELGVTLRQRARVLRVETDSAGLATGVTYVDRATGKTHFQAGRTVVLSANGIGTPRILLASASNAHPHGLANSSGLVGKNLMMHPYSTVVGLFEDAFESWQGPFGQRAYSLEFAETRADRGFYRGAKWQLMGTGGPLNTTGSFPWGGSGAWGPDFHHEVHRRFGHSAYWAILAEDLPDESNAVTLDDTLVDSNGMPAPKVTYSASANTHALLEFNHALAEQSMREAGAYETLVSPIVRETGWHLLGTVRMGDDPATSVVDGFGRAHDVPNLFVMDGSVMPTSGAVNPTGTVAALALRNTEAAIEHARAQKVSINV